MYDYSIGGTDRKQEGADAISELPQNKTLFVQKLTADAPFAPEMTQGLKTMDEVFAHFRPALDVEFQTEEGTSHEEHLMFNNLGDFGPNGISKQSTYLQDLKNQEDNYLKVVKELKSNKALQTALQSPDSKQAFLTSILAMIKELEEQGA